MAKKAPPQISARHRCLQIVNLLKPTMAGQRADSVAVMMPAATLSKVYDFARRGSRSRS